MDDLKKNKKQLIEELTKLRLENNSLKSQSNEKGRNKPVINDPRQEEEKLASEQTLLRTLVDLLPTFVYVKDLKSRFLIANTACANYMGASSSRDLIGKTDADFYSPKVAANFLSDEKGVLKGIPVINKEEIGVYSSGDRMILLTTKVPFHDNEGNIIGLMGTSSDITESKQAEEILRSSEERFKIIFEYAPDAYYLSNLKGDFVDGNIAAEKITGYLKKELVGKNFLKLDILSPKQIPKAAKLLIRSSIGKATGPEEFVLKRKDGSKVEVEIITHPVRIKNETLILGIARDVEERKQAVEAQRESELRSHQIINNAPFGAHNYELQPGQRLVFIGANPAADKILGIDNQLFVGKTIEEAFPPLAQTEVPEKYRQVAVTGVPYDTEQLNYEDGRIQGAFEIHAFQTNPNHMTVFFVEITDRKNAEEMLIKSKEKAEESDRLKSAFLANMSHEIRTPMNGILGFAELLKDQMLTGEEQQVYINIIEKSGNRMLNILNDLIDISRIESGQMKINLSDCDLNSQFEYIYSFFKPEAENKGLELYTKIGLPGNEAIIKTDTEKVNAILLNLLKNAIKFTDQGAIEFGYVRKGKYLEFFVKDTGVGFPKEQNEIIFERFRQGSETLVRNYEGSGLGLCISKAYVEMLHGKIWGESEEGKGSIFHFTIPYNADQSKGPDKKNATPDGKEADQIKPLKILIAEDDRISEKLITKTVNKFARELVIVRNGNEAVKSVVDNPDLDLVLMDIKMPQLDGYEATRKIRQFNKKVIIIAQTAFAMHGEREKAIDAGCNDYISKPIKKALLIELLEKHFK